MGTAWSKTSSKTSRTNGERIIKEFTMDDDGRVLDSNIIKNLWAYYKEDICIAGEDPRLHGIEAIYKTLFLPLFENIDREDNIKLFFIVANETVVEEGFAIAKNKNSMQNGKIINNLDDNNRLFTSLNRISPGYKRYILVRLLAYD